MKTALVTGASSGIGLEFSRQLAKMGYALAMVSNREQELAEAAEGLRAEFGVPVVGISSRTGLGLDEVARHVQPRRTIALVGSSGVGKSTLVNVLAGEEMMATGDIQEWSGKGRHTTTSRELVMLPCGAMALDTPGLRELGVLGADGFELKGRIGGGTHRYRK